jgi:small subunit ribosomal protein S4
MGDPKKPKKKYSRPSHPWVKSRIDSEKILMKEYGLKNKKQLWRMEKILANFKDQVKRLTAATGAQAEKEKAKLRARLEKLDLLKKDQDLGDVLSLELTAILDRRLQSRVAKKELARSISQSRQFIIHEHIKVGDKVINSPSYIVNIKEDSQISFVDKSALSSPDHPERVVITEAQDLKRKTEELKKEVEVKPVEDIPIEGKEQNIVTEETVEEETKKEELKKEVEVKPVEDVPIEGKEQNIVTEETVEEETKKEDKKKEVKEETKEETKKEDKKKEVKEETKEESTVKEETKEESTVKEETKESENNG